MIIALERLVAFLVNSMKGSIFVNNELPNQELEEITEEINKDKMK